MYTLSVSVIASTNNLATSLFLCSVFKYLHLSVSGGLGSIFTAQQLHAISFICHIFVTLVTGKCIKWANLIIRKYLSAAPAPFSYIPTSILRNNENYKQNYVLKLLSKETLLVYDPTINKVVLLFARMRLIFGSIIYTLIVMFLILTIRSLKKRKPILRKKTFRLQKMLIRTLVIHTMIPIFGLLLPLIVMPLIINTYMPALQTMNVMLVGMSTILNNLSTIYFIKPYRRAVCRALACGYQKSSTIQVSKSSMMNSSGQNGSLVV